MSFNTNNQEKLNQALNFINKVNNRFKENQTDIYKTFIDILCKFQNEQLNVEDNDDLISLKYEVYIKITKLLKDHQDLLFEFYEFLPSETVEVDNNLKSQQTVAIIKRGKLIN
jgi:histone deacetylase complex regulatory component SIN3